MTLDMIIRFGFFHSDEFIDALFPGVCDRADVNGLVVNGRSRAETLQGGMWLKTDGRGRDCRTGGRDDRGRARSGSRASGDWLGSRARGRATGCRFWCRTRDRARSRATGCRSGCRTRGRARNRATGCRFGCRARSRADGKSHSHWLHRLLVVQSNVQGVFLSGFGLSDVSDVVGVSFGHGLGLEDIGLVGRRLGLGGRGNSLNGPFKWRGGGGLVGNNVSSLAALSVLTSVSLGLLMSLSQLGSGASMGRFVFSHRLLVSGRLVVLHDGGRGRSRPQKVLVGPRANTETVDTGRQETGALLGRRSPKGKGLKFWGGVWVGVVEAPLEEGLAVFEGGAGDDGLGGLLLGVVLLQRGVDRVLGGLLDKGETLGQEGAGVAA